MASILPTTGIRQLYIARNAIGDHGAAAIAEACRRCPYAIVSFVSSYNRFLSLIDFSDNAIGVKGGKAIGDSLKAIKSITSLSLTKNNLGNMGVKYLSDSLKEVTSLVSLYIGVYELYFYLISKANNEIDQAGAAVLAEDLKQNKSLTLLDISGNKIGDEGANLIINALKLSGNAISTLDLSSNMIGDATGVEIAEMLRVNTTLTSLNLRNNFLVEK